MPGKPGRGRAEDARGFGEVFERLGRGRAQGLGRQPWRGAAQGAQRFRHGAGAQDRRSGQRWTALGVQPRRGLLMLTRWTVPMATGMSDVVMLWTTLAGREAVAVGARAAAADGVHRLVVRGREGGRALARRGGRGGKDVGHGAQADDHV